jgi:hypothetical protein
VSHSRIQRPLANTRKKIIKFFWGLMSHVPFLFNQTISGRSNRVRRLLLLSASESDKRALIFLQPVQAPCFIHNVFCKVWFVVCFVHNVFCDSVVRHAETYFMLLMTMMFLLSFSTLSVSISPV